MSHIELHLTLTYVKLQPKSKCRAYIYLNKLLLKHALNMIVYPCVLTYIEPILLSHLGYTVTFIDTLASSVIRKCAIWNLVSTMASAEKIWLLENITLVHVRTTSMETSANMTRAVVISVRMELPVRDWPIKGNYRNFTQDWPLLLTVGFSSYSK